MADLYWTLKLTIHVTSTVCLARRDPLQHAVIYKISFLADQLITLLLCYFLQHPILLYYCYYYYYYYCFYYY